MANTENLKSFRKGQSGNPAGRPVGSRNVSTVLANMLAEIAPDVVVEASFVKDISKGLKQATIADAAAARIVYQAIVKGDSWALKELLDRTEGKPKERLQISHNDDVNAAAKVANNFFEERKNLNDTYGVPMPDEEFITAFNSRLAENFGVDEQELIARIALIDKTIEL